MNKPNTTYPKLLLENAGRYKNRVAMREKRKGIWLEISWQEYYRKVEILALGLKELGLSAGAHLSILAENCPEWIYTDLAVQSLRAITVGIYPTSSKEQIHYIIDHSCSSFVVVGDQEQADKLLAIKELLPDLKKIIVIDMKGLKYYDDPLIESYQAIESTGRAYEKADPGQFDLLVERTKPEDIAFLIYTSGTTGPPKGCMIAHQNHLLNVEGMNEILGFTVKDSVVSYLPLCHILERTISINIPLVCGNTINFAESIETVQADIQEIEPTFFAAVPRILEKMHSGLLLKLDNTTRFKRLMVDTFLPVGKKVAGYRMARKRVPLHWLLVSVVANLLILRPLREKLGLHHCRLMMSGGAPIAPEILSFFHSLGVFTIELWSQTESCVGGTGPHHDVKPGSVGQPISTITLKLADDGEILIQKDSVFAGYHRDPQATEEVLRDGWLHTGDIGRFEEGHLYIIDRKKDIIITSGGKNISPSEIENELKCSPYIKEAIVFGDGRKYLSALIQLDFENVSNWAQANKIPYTNYKSLALHPEVGELISSEISTINEGMARVEQVKKFRVLEKELDQDDEELTATQKVKRSVIEKRFRTEIEQMYQTNRI